MRFSSIPKVASLARCMALTLTLALAACSSPEERARAHYESGQQLLVAGDFLRAGLEFRNAISFNDKHAEAWQGLADVEEKNENWGQALEALKRVVELDPSRVEARTRLAKLLFVAADLEGAMKNVTAANELRKDDTAILALRAAILFRLGDREGARNDAERSLSFDSNNPDAHAVLAADLMQDKNTIGALRYIDRGLTADPDNLGLLLFKLKIHDDTKDDEKAEAVLRQIIGYYPKMKEMRQALLKFLMDKKRYAEAESELRSMIAGEPGNTNLALDLVRFLGRAKGAEAARAELVRLIAANPGVNAFPISLAELDFAEKKTDAAVAALDAIIAKGEPKEDAVRARLILASMRLQLKDVEAAKKLVGQILESDAKNTDALTMRASMKLDAGETESAIGDLREALNQSPQSVAILHVLAKAHERAGTIDLATEHYAEAVKLANYNPRLVLEFGAFLERQGKKNQAQSILEEALSRHPEDRELLVAMSRVRIAKQDWEGAQQIAETLKKIGDASGVSNQILASALLGQKKYDESIEVLKDSQTAAPDKIRPMKNLVAAYLQAGKASEAEAFLDSVLKANDKNAEAHILRGLVSVTQKKNAEAEASFRRAIELQPASAVGYVALARFQTEAQQLDKAEETLRLGLSKVPGDHASSLALAGLLERRNDFEGAIAVYEEQLKATPEGLIVINNLASLIADHRSDAESLDRAFKISRRLAGVEMPQFKDTLGWIAYRRGEYQTALDLLTKAAAEAPAIDGIRYHLAMTHIAMKQPAVAKGLLTAIDAKIKDGDPLKALVRAGLASADAPNQNN